MKTKTNKTSFGIVMASDEKYMTYIQTAVRSIRKYNKLLPINVYSCGKIDNFFDKNDKNCNIKIVTPPEKLKKSLNVISEFEHALTRIAKLESMNNNDFKKLIYIDSDIIALTDINKITEELSLGDDLPVVYLLLRRPSMISITDISWLYFKNSSDLTPQQMADLVNDTFKTDYSSEKLLNIKCWNGGIIYGSSEGIHILANLWKNFYLKMLTGPNRNSFIPNDQLCLWLTVDQLKNKISFRELPLKWNFMPGHAMESLIKSNNPNLKEIRDNLVGVNILHLAQNKIDIWAQILINDINSQT